MFNKVNKIPTGDDILDETDKWDTHWIKGFDWMDNAWIKNIFDDHFYVNVSALKIKGSAILHKVNINEDEKTAYLAGIKYGSWWYLMDESPITDEEKDNIITSIINRAKTILYLISNPILSFKKWEEYLKSVLSFLVYEMNKPLVNLNNQNIVGWQKDVRFDQAKVEEYPFEALLNLNSTIGRIIAIQNWESLVSHPNFAKQKSYENVFGLIIDNDLKYKSKH